MDAVLTRSADSVETPEPTGVFGEIGAIVDSAVRSLMTDADHRAAVCGCRGCKAQATQAAEWGRAMLASDDLLSY
jgi:hypothetical protein